jgi:hypothetical protein
MSFLPGQQGKDRTAVWVGNSLKYVSSHGLLYVTIWLLYCNKILEHNFYFVKRINLSAKSRVRAQHTQRHRIFPQMLKRAPRNFISDRADEIDIKKIFPRLALQWARFDFGQIDIAQRKNDIVL